MNDTNSMSAPVQAGLSDAQIDEVWHSMPGGPAGWLKQFGYYQFAQAIERAAIAQHVSATPGEAVGYVTSNWKHFWHPGLVSHENAVAAGMIPLYAGPIEAARTPAATPGDAVAEIRLSSPNESGECFAMINTLGNFDLEHFPNGTKLYLGARTSAAPLLCWSCKRQYTADQRLDADGQCPHCDVEIELGNDTPAAPVVDAEPDYVSILLGTTDIRADGTTTITRTPMGEAHAERLSGAAPVADLHAAIPTWQERHNKRPQISQHDHKMNEIADLRAALARTAAAELVASHAPSVPCMLAFDGYHDDDEHFGNTILDLVRSRLEVDPDDLAEGDVFHVTACWTQPQEWRVVRSGNPFEVERVMPPVAAAPKESDNG